MAETKNIFSEFSAASADTWEAAAKAELNGKDPWTALRKQDQGLTLEPYYDRGGGPLLLEPDENEFLGPRVWYNCPVVPVKDETTANQRALDHLRNGADGIFFELEGKEDIEKLCAGISLQDCSVNFSCNDPRPIVPSLNRLLSANPDTLPGAFFSDTPIPTIGRYRTSGFRQRKGATIAEGIANTLKEIQQRALKQCGPASIAISITVSPDFILAISLLRAYRVVWQRLLEKEKCASTPLHLHADVARTDLQPYDPHAQMIFGTTAAMASILGGCNTMTIAPGDATPAASRVARNVSNLLRCESHLHRVADPVAGSYTIDSLTTQAADAAWKILSGKA